jgi:hypothetical protein
LTIEPITTSDDVLLGKSGNDDIDGGDGIDRCIHGNGAGTLDEFAAILDV